VPQAGEPARQRAADFAGANDADFHVLVPFRLTLIKIFIPIRSVRHLDFVKDDVSCLDMPAGHSWSDSGTPAPSLLRRRGRS
jgi:hypothetical protein